MANGRRIERGHKTDSYISAIQGNPVPVALPQLSEEPAPLLPAATPSGSARLPEEGGRQTPKSQHSGPLTDAELEPYRRDPYWRKCRAAFFCCLCLIVLFLIFLIFFLIWRFSPTCAPLPAKWWQGALIYQLWVPSFKDSDGNGLGDLGGVSSKLDALQHIGVTTIFPRPFISTDESGQGVLDFLSVDEVHGGLSAARKLIEDAHELGIKVVIDVPIVATSDEHDWFQRSARASKPENAEFSSFYYWKRNVEPSAYVDRYKNSSVLYFHVKDRPDLPILNWKSENVTRAVKNALSFWIDAGIDGFHLANVENLARTADASEPDWPKVAEILRGIRDHVDTYKNESIAVGKKDIFLIASPEPIKEEHKRLLKTDAGLDAIVNTELDKVARSNKICYRAENNVAGCSNEILSDLLSGVTAGVSPVWEFGNVLTSRLATRAASRVHAELLTMLQLLLPGTTMVYYGDEIGLRDSPDGAFPQRGAMPWSDGAYGDFSTAPPSVPLSNDYVNINVARQNSDAKSPLKTFKKLGILRGESGVIVNGKTYISKAFKDAFSLVRFDQEDDHNNGTTTSKGCIGSAIIAVANFGKRGIKHSIADLPVFTSGLSDLSSAKVIAVNSNARNFNEGQSVDLSSGQIELGPEEGVVLKVKPV
uniref:alpha-glucosidase n=1 Tax=Panagrellus redivivus TaxID=6233 RepID=A0A7E4V1V3_PANRE